MRAFWNASGALCSTVPMLAQLSIATVVHATSDAAATCMDSSLGMCPDAWLIQKSRRAPSSAIEIAPMWNGPRSPEMLSSSFLSGNSRKSIVR